jgi:type I restriction enzyme S subunit
MNCKPYLDYKESGVQWLGEVPEGWETLSLRRLIKYVKTGTTPSGAEEYHFEDGGFNWYSPSDFSDAVYLGAANRALSAEGKAEVRIFPKMTVMLVGIGATIGKVGLAANESSCNQQINAIICNGKLDPIFATYSLKTMRDFIVKCGKFTTMPIINQDESKNLILAVPPIFEQTAIADFLDRETGRIDALVAKKRRLIALLGEKRTALISRTVTCGLPADAAREFGLEPHTGFKDSGIEWLGEVPEGWEALPLRRLIKYVKTGTTPSGVEEYHFEEGGFNWYSPSDFSDAVYLGAANRALSAEGTAEVRIFPEMTVMLVGIGATIGKVGLAATESSCNQQINAIICNGKLDPIFATYYLKTMRDFIVKCGKFTTMPIINQDETKNLILTVPPLPEQTAIAAYLDRATATIDQLVTKVEAAIVRLLEYRTALITAAVTGKIDVRGKAGLDTD